MAHKTKINGTTYEISGGTAKVGGTKYSISKGRTMVGGTGYEISFKKPLSEFSVGESVYLNVNGTSREFLVIHQGLPSSIYDSSCEGTWLMMKEVYTTRTWDSTNNDYKNSDAHTYLNNTFLNYLDSDVQSAIQQVKIPYVNDTGSRGTVATGSNGLSTKIFLLSAYEVGCKKEYSTIPVEEGVKLDYFTQGLTSGADRRIAYSGSSVREWHLRSPVTNGTAYNWYVSKTGVVAGGGGVTTTRGIRPAFVMDSSVLF